MDTVRCIYESIKLSKLAFVTDLIMNGNSHFLDCGQMAPEKVGEITSITDIFTLNT